MNSKDGCSRWWGWKGTPPYFRHGWQSQDESNKDKFKMVSVRVIVLDNEARSLSQGRPEHSSSTRLGVIHFCTRAAKHKGWNWSMHFIKGCSLKQCGSILSVVPFGVYHRNKINSALHDSSVMASKRKCRVTSQSRVELTLISKYQEPISR